MVSDYYQKVPMTYAIGHLHSLFKILNDNGAKMVLTDTKPTEPKVEEKPKAEEVKVEETKTNES